MSKAIQPPHLQCPRCNYVNPPISSQCQLCSLLFQAVGVPTPVALPQSAYPQIGSQAPYSPSSTSYGSQSHIAPQKTGSLNAHYSSPPVFAPQYAFPQQSLPPGGPAMGIAVSAKPVMASPVHGNDGDNDKPLQEFGNGDARSERMKDRFKYSESQYRDVWFFVLFVAHLITILVVGVVYGRRMISEVWNGTTGEEPSDPNRSDGDEKMLLLILSTSVFVAAGFGMAWLAVLKTHGRSIIKTSMVVECVLLTVGTVVAFLTRNYLMGVLYLVITALTLVYFYVVRRRIPFAEAMLSCATQAIREYGGVVVVSYLAMFLQIVWSVWWSFTLAGVYHSTQGRIDTSRDQFLLFWLVVSYYWTSTVIMNISHVTTAGVVATWWLVPSAPHSPTCPALRRATSTSFGSLCLGSLIVGLLSAVRWTLRMARAEGDNIVLCMVDCLLGWLDWAIRFFNRYAFTYVAVYGFDFRTAASHTWDMFQASGIDALINDDLTGLALGLSAIIGGVLTAFVGGLWAYSSHITGWLGVAVLTFVIGFVLTMVTMSTISSGVATTFVLWAEDPDGMASTKPAQFNKIRMAAAGLYPSFANQSDSAEPVV